MNCASRQDSADEVEIQSLDKYFLVEIFGPFGVSLPVSTQSVVLANLFPPELPGQKYQKGQKGQQTILSLPGTPPNWFEDRGGNPGAGFFHAILLYSRNETRPITCPDWVVNCAQKPAKPS
jgi:hypothetical protein